MNSSLRPAFLSHIAQTSPQPDGLEVSHGKGIYLYDTKGNAYVDCISGIAVSSLGHGHHFIASAIRKQLDLHLHTMVYGEHIQAPQVELAERLADSLPDTLDCTFFTNSGAEAVEGALKLARKWTSRYDILACYHAYHGSTAGAESLRSDLAHTNAMRPLVPGVRHIRFNSTEDFRYIDMSTAAVIIEPIQGEAGVIVPDAGYLKALKAHCSQQGALLILDEIQTGMGRTGSLWAFEQEDMTPDILLLAKAFGGGLPLGAFISGKEIMSVLATDPILSHLSTFGGHPLSCAASLAALEVITNNGLLAQCRAVGDELKTLISRHPRVQEVRGRGLMLAVELKNPGHIMPAIEACRKNGLLLDWFLFNNRCIRLYPPLITTHTETVVICEKMLAALDTLRD